MTAVLVVAFGRRATFQNSGMSLSIGIFFSLMITGLAARLPQAPATGLQLHHGLLIVFTTATVMVVFAALATLLRPNEGDRRHPGAVPEPTGHTA